MKNYKVSTTFTVDTSAARQGTAQLARDIESLAEEARGAQAATRGIGAGLGPVAAGYEAAATRANAARLAIGGVGSSADASARHAKGSIDDLTRSAEKAQMAMKAVGTPALRTGSSVVGITPQLPVPPRRPVLTPAPIGIPEPPRRSILPPAVLNIPEQPRRIDFQPVRTGYAAAMERAREAMRPSTPPTGLSLGPIETQLRTVEASARRTRLAVAAVGSGGTPPTGLRTVAAAAGSIPPASNRAAASLRGLTPPINQAAEAARSAERTGTGALQRLGASTAGLRSHLVGIALGFASIGGGIALLKGVVQDQTDIQTRAIGIAALVNGNTPNGDWNRSLAQSHALIRGMLRDAKELPGEFKDFASAANSLVAPMMQIGMDLDDVRRRAAQAVQIAMIDTSGNSPDVVGAQLGRILMGQAGMEMTTWAMLRGQLDGMQAEQFNQLPAKERARVAFGAIDNLTENRGFQASVARSTAVQYSQVRENLMGQDGIGGAVGLWASRQLVTEAREVNRLFRENPRLVASAGSAISDIVIPAIKTGGAVVRTILTDMTSIRNVALATGAIIATWRIGAAFAPASMAAGESAAGAGFRRLAAMGSTPIIIPALPNWRGQASRAADRLTRAGGLGGFTTLGALFNNATPESLVGRTRAVWAPRAVAASAALNPIRDAASWTRSTASGALAATGAAVGRTARATGASNLLYSSAFLTSGALNGLAAKTGMLTTLFGSMSIAALPVIAGIALVGIPLAALAGAVVVVKNNLFGLGDFFKDSTKYLGQSLWGLGKNLGGLFLAIGVPLGTILVPVIGTLAILLGGAAELLTKLLNAIGGAVAAVSAYAGALSTGDFVGAPDAARDAWDRFSFSQLVDDALESSREKQKQAEFDKQRQEKNLKGSGNINIAQLVLNQNFANAQEPERFAANFYKELDKLRRGRAQLPASLPY